MDASDSSLLREFIGGTGEAPFRQLVGRYQDLVYSTALRRLGDRGRAEEVAQDVFVLLSEKARVLVRHPNLAGWLYRTTLSKAANRMKSETRRELREERFADESRMMANREDAPVAACELVDDALARLPEKDREALVLRFFQDLNLAAVGRAQGTSAEAARKRVDRALARLSTVFRRKGAAASSPAIVAGLLADATHSAPAGLLTSATGAATPPPALSAVTTLFDRMLTMTWTQTAACTIVLAGIPLAIQQVTLANLQKEERQLRQQISSAPSAAPGVGPPTTDPANGSPPGGDAGPGGGAATTPPDADVGLEDFQALARLGEEIERSRAVAEVRALAVALDLGEALSTAIQERALDNLAREKERSRLQMMQIGKSTNAEELQSALADSQPIELFDGIETILDGDQHQRFEQWMAEREEAEMRTLLESFAYDDLEELQRVLRLTDEQKQKAFEILVQEWTGAEDEPPPPDQQRDYEAEARRDMENRLKKFAEILSEEELRVYRMHLEKQLE